MDTFDSDQEKNISKEITKGLDKLEIQKTYVDYLKEKGYRPKIDSNGDISFKHEGRTYWIDVQSRDTEFFRLILPLWSISQAERVQVLEAASYSNATSKVSKVYIVGKHALASAEIFVAKPEHFQEVFQRMISALNHGLAQFIEKMRELNDKD